MTKRIFPELQAKMVAGILGCVLLTAGCERPGSMGGNVVWSDPDGDVQELANLPDRPTPDLHEVMVDSKNGELVAELSLKNLRKRLDYVSADGKRHGASLVDILIDTDIDPSTGGAPLSLWRLDARPARFGYEFRIALLAGFRYHSADGGAGRTVGDVSLDSTNKDKIEPIVTYQIWALSAQRFGGKHIDLIEADSARLDTELALLDNDTVRLRIPYNYLGVKPGGKVRIAYLDVQESASTEAALSNDQTLTLK